MRNCLIVIDMQNDFISGSLGTKEAEVIVPKVEKLVKEAEQKGDAIIYTRDTHSNNYLETPEGKKLPIKHCIKDTRGWEIPSNIKSKVSLVYNKPTFGMNWKGILDSNSPDITITIVGLCTDICVISNALILKQQYPEANIQVIADCCAGTTPELHEAALKVMGSCQINVIRNLW